MVRQWWNWTLGRLGLRRGLPKRPLREGNYRFTERLGVGYEGPGGRVDLFRFKEQQVVDESLSKVPSVNIHQNNIANSSPRRDDAPSEDAPPDAPGDD